MAERTGRRSVRLDEDATATHIIGRLLGYVVREGRWRGPVVLVCILVSAAAGVAGALFTQALIDDFITPLLGRTDPDWGPLTRALVLIAAVYLAGVVMTLAYNWLVVAIAQQVLRRVRNEMFAHMQRLSLRFFDTHSAGDLMSRYTNDTDTLRQMISQALPQLVSSIASVVAVMVSMIVLSWQLTLFVLAGGAVLLAVARALMSRSGRYFARQQRSIGAVNGFAEESVSGQRVIKVFTHERATQKRFDELNDSLFEDSDLANSYANILMPATGGLGNLLYVVVAVAGGALAISGTTPVTIGVIAAFLQLTRSFTMPLSQIAQQLNSVVMAVAGAQRIFGLLDEEPESDEGRVTLDALEVGRSSSGDPGTRRWQWTDPTGITLPEPVFQRGDVRFDQVTFGYDPEKPVLHDITLFAKPGQKIALVGATGAGKTTITNLLTRFYDVDRGTIRIDGIDVLRMRKADLRASLGIVLQDTSLFSGSVTDNIRFGRLDATDQEVLAAARLAHADEFIRTLPHGYDTELEGTSDTLSQGQRQLLAIARAAISDPPVMILDEATSSVDTHTEALVQQGMDALMTGRTVFVIAHRLSTIENSDVIMVLDHGRIIERGSDEELMARHGTYYALRVGTTELD